MTEGTLRILIVDDEQVVHEAIGDYLEDLGHHVVHASDGQTGLDEMRNTDIDVALVDLRMPRMDGMTLIEQARGKNPDTTFVLVTGHAHVAKVAEARRRGADDFLLKPVKLQELEEVLERVLRMRE